MYLDHKTTFQKQIFDFNFENKYLKPWQKSREPYNIWLFEIIMQQTRMQQGIPYYERIIARFPTLKDLALASEEDLFKLWKGLGYYSRARNLHFTARYIYTELNGIFPNTYSELLKLKGIGEYTAAAISSFSFDEDIAVLDGNVFRILSRYFGIKENIYTSQGKKKYQALANSLLTKGKSKQFNQNIMDLGSQICTPQSPSCSDCLFQNTCFAYNQDKISEFPPKKVRIELKVRYFYNVFVEVQEKFYIIRRADSDVWKGLFQGYLIENQEFDLEEFNSFFGTNLKYIEFGEWDIQKLSHQKIFMKNVLIKLDKTSHSMDSWVSKKEFLETPFPRIISQWVEKNMSL